MSLGSVPNCQDVSWACPKPLGSSSETSTMTAHGHTRFSGSQGCKATGRKMTTGGFVILSSGEPSELPGELSHT